MSLNSKVYCEIPDNFAVKGLATLSVHTSLKNTSGLFLVKGVCRASLKGSKVHPEMNILSSCTHPHVIKPE